MAPGEERPLHSFFVNHTRRKISGTETPQRSHIDHVQDRPESRHSAKEDITDPDGQRRTTEVCSSNQAPIATPSEHLNAGNGLSEQKGQNLEVAPEDGTLLELGAELQQPRKRRKLEVAETSLSWDEQLRSHAQGPSSGQTDNSSAPIPNERSPSPDSRLEAKQSDENHTIAEYGASEGDVCADPSASLSLTPDIQQERKNENPSTGECPSNLQSSSDKPDLDDAVTIDPSEESRKNNKNPLKFDSKGKLVLPGMRSSGVESKKAQTNGAMRKTRSSRGRRQTGFIISIPYGSDEQNRMQIARRIDFILLSEQTDNSLTIKDRPSKAQEENRGKALHPFFMPGKRRQAPPQGQAGPPETTESSAHEGSEQTRKNRNSSAATPGKLRAQAKAIQSDTLSNAFSSSLNTDRKRAVKHLGTPGALWPPPGMVHVRGLSANLGDQCRLKTSQHQVGVLEPRGRKMKNGTFSPQHLYEIFTDTHNITAAHSRIHHSPERLLISGTELQKLVSKQLSYNVVESETGRGQDTSGTRARGVTRYSRFMQDFESIKSGLASFDLGFRETEPWLQKYAPSSADQVLQPGPELAALRDWLTTLAVKSVEKGQPSDVKTLSSRKNEASRLKKKKRKKRDDIDDFIVSSDDKDDMMEHMELSENDTLQSPDSKHSKSIFRVGDLTTNSKTRMTNAVLLSGPHGCGKSASVYAVAKELGFEVFELNSGSRRGGKELFEKVGDLAENHLYQSTSGDVSNLSADEDSARLGSALQKDLSTGRQGTMTSFFTSKPSSAARPKKVNATKKPIPKPKPSDGQSSSKQKQSLILLEEVDVLFEEDKNFWPSLIALALSSKRPIVMTCNDESLVPLETLNLHAILRFSSPSPDVVADYLLLMAANEGHLITRSTVSNLFLSRGHDFRATIQQLDFWCQMGIGDKKGGLEWIYQRWPSGEDLDAHGDRLRVVSKDTFIDGLQRPYQTHECTGVSENGMNDRGGSDRYSNEVISASTHGDGARDLGGRSGFQAMQNEFSILEELELAFDGRSAADISCGSGHTTKYNDTLDPTEPEIDETARVDFIEGYQLIQADLKVHFTETDHQLFAEMTSHANSVLAQSGLQDTYSPEQPPFDEGSVGSTSVCEHVQEAQTQFLNYGDFLTTFEPLTEPGPQSTLQSTAPGVSVFEGTLRPIVEDVAPYVRSIVAYDLALEDYRLQQSNLLSQGGRNAKKARLTRASRSALEGSKRETTRRSRWFTKSLNAKLVLKTAGRCWTLAPELVSSTTASREASVD
ncbi:MAG: hypothetical protein M1821_000302 [Bathelium mastoideum]|nr:MAG: hypothetical protein M1821_000302 [Bathelium mastoideum]